MNIKELLDICIDKNLIDMTISSRKLKDETKAQKVKIRPVIIKDTFWSIRYLSLLEERCCILIIHRKMLRSV